MSIALHLPSPLNLQYYSILIAVNSVVKISDFGASREWRHEMSTPMSFCGTPAWLAPELIRNEPCSERVDVWYASEYSTVLYFTRYSYSTLVNCAVHVHSQPSCSCSSFSCAPLRSRTKLLFAIAFALACVLELGVITSDEMKSLLRIALHVASHLSISTHTDAHSLVTRAVRSPTTHKQYA